MASETLTAVGHVIIIGADGREGWAQPYQELIWEIPVTNIATSK